MSLWASLVACVRALPAALEEWLDRQADRLAAWADPGEE